MRIKPSSYFLILILLIMAVVIGDSLTFARWESSVAPLIIASFVFVFAGVLLRAELSAKKKTAKVTEEEQPAPEKTRFSSMLGWVLGFTLASYLVGLVIALPIFLFSYLKWRGRGWVSAIAVAIITTALIYAIFELGLQTHLWEGVIFGAGWL